MGNCGFKDKKNALKTEAYIVKPTNNQREVVCNHKPDCISRQDVVKEFVALFQYRARTQEEIDLRKNDRVFILNQNDSDWWFVQNIRDSRKGFIPSSYVAAVGSLEAEDWFNPQLSRKESERLLLMIGNGKGSFLVRTSETSQGGLTLSLRDRERASDSKQDCRLRSLIKFNELIKHYHIYQNPETGSFYIAEKRQFEHLKSMIEFYSMSPKGLACTLDRACLRPAPITSDLSVLTKNHWAISHDSIELLEKLGSGQFGEVWKGLWNKTTEVAVKTLKPGAMSRDEFLKEARIMKALHHEKLVQLYAVCMDEPIYIIFELMSSGSLLTHLRSPAGRCLDIVKLVDMMVQIASGMYYLESQQFIHRDLAARNILVGEDNVVKIADFGLARVVSELYNGTYQANKETKFPVKWTAPEAALHHQFSTKSDVWSYGVVLYEIVTYGEQPYPSMSNQETLQKVRQGYRMPKRGVCPDSIYRQMLRCWDAVPDRRPSFKALYEYFEETCVSKLDPCLFLDENREKSIDPPMALI
ncbi:hypothetical protein Ciccas_013155 [Cichlidogyrus casuarinus]|uniref:Tyrosine-protein kinase n=1 Tax=Cichlidogyrus casuarinus TaxID=1844966 RepID=A0ABD2PLB7_9PLAT